MNFEGFSRADVEVLKSSPSEPVKIALVDKLHKNFRLEKLSMNERLVAEEILRYLAADISVNIRQRIATKFCDNTVISYDIALKLANDLEDIVALPIIENSTLLKEQDLINIIESGNGSRQKAVAKRPDLSENLCAHIIHRTAPEVVAELVGNKKVTLSENNCEILLKNHSGHQPLMKFMIASRKITPTQAHELLTMVTSDLQKMLIVEYNIPSNVVNNLIHDSKEMIISNMIMSNLESRNQATAEQMIKKLHDDGDLSFSVVVKALSFGNLDFFEAGIARIAEISTADARRVLWESDGDTGFKKLYLKCRLPESMGDAIYRMTLITKEEMAHEGTDLAKLHYRILNRLARISNNEKIGNLDYLVTIVAYNLKKANLL